MKNHLPQDRACPHTYGSPLPEKFQANEKRKTTMTSASLTTKEPRLIPVTRWNEFHLWPPQGGLRYLIFNASRNGFDAVLRRCGRRVLIDEAAFFKWMKTGRKN